MTNIRYAQQYIYVPLVQVIVLLIMKNSCQRGSSECRHWGAPKYQKVFKISLPLDIFCINIYKGNFCKQKYAKFRICLFLIQNVFTTTLGDIGVKMWSPFWILALEVPFSGA